MRGMAFNYTGSTSQSINVTSTSGLASQIYQIAQTNSASSGSLQTLISNLQSTDDDMQTQVNTHPERRGDLPDATCRRNTPTIRQPSKQPTTRWAI